MTSPQVDLLGKRPNVGNKAPCVAATTANITLSGAQTIDGVSVVSGNRVLVKNQTTNTENGLYVCNSGAWTRAVDFNKANDVASGVLVNVSGGATQAGIYEVTFSGDYVAGTTVLTISVFDALSITPSEVETGYNSAVAAASQAEVEAGTETGIRRLSPLRIFQAIAARLKQAVDMSGAILSGHSGSIITISANTDLNNTTHRGAILLVQNATLTARLQSAVTYGAGHQCLVTTTHASGCTVAVEGAATLNGSAGGSIAIPQNEAYGLIRISSDVWLLPNG